MTMQSTSPRYEQTQAPTGNEAKKMKNRRAGILLTAGLAVVSGMYLTDLRPWSVTSMATTASAPAPVVTTAPVAVADASGLAVGSTLTFDTDAGQVVLNVTGINGDMVTVADSEGDSITVNREQLTVGTLPTSNIERNAKRMAEVVAERAASGYYEQHKGHNGAWE